jgi:hypothetical protein
MSGSSYAVNKDGEKRCKSIAGYYFTKPHAYVNEGDTWRNATLWKLKKRFYIENT